MRAIAFIAGGPTVRDIRANCGNSHAEPAPE